MVASIGDKAEAGNLVLFKMKPKGGAKSHPRKGQNQTKGKPKLVKKTNERIAINNSKALS
tara:strand:+ start:370 stop:549 length:180 start_codon:yes stop_codon:yes gene_type:complete